MWEEPCQLMWPMLMIVIVGNVVTVLYNGLQVWFYEHITRFHVHDKEKFPRTASWPKVDHGGRYDAFELVRDIKESDVWVKLLVLLWMTLRANWGGYNNEGT